METGFPLVMLIGPIVLALVSLVGRRHRRVVAAIGLVSVALLTLLLALAAPDTGLFGDNTAGLFGRAIVLTPVVRSLFLFIYPALGVLFLFAWFRPLGRALIPAGLVVLSPLAAALMVSPISLGAILLVVAAAVLIPALHDGRYEAAGAAWRYFLLVAVAAAPLLVTASGRLDGTTSLSWLAPLSATLIILGGFPFHVWVAGLTRHSPAAALALALGLAQLVVVVFLLTLLDTAPAARATIEFQTAIRWSAALTAMIGAFRMARAADWRGVAGGALLLDMGFLLPAALAPGADGLMIALPALINRYLSLLLIALGYAWPVAGSGNSRAARVAAVLRPAMLIYGCLSLVGLPLTPGFAGRWAEVAAVGEGGSSWPVILLLVGLAVGAAAVFRAARGWRQTVEPGVSRGPAASGVESAIHASLLGLALLLGIFPDITAAIVTGMLGLG